MPSISKKTKKTSSKRSPGLWPPAGISRTIVLAILVLASTLGVYYVEYGSAASPELVAGYGGSYANNTGGGDCLDDNGDGGSGSVVDIWPCNGSAAQHYSFSSGLIHVGAGCARVSGASSTNKAYGGGIVIGGCQTGSSAPWGALWTKQGGTFHNNHNGQCLTGSNGKAQAHVEGCLDTSHNINQRWFPDTYGATSSGGGGGGGTTTSAGTTIFNWANSYVGMHEDCGANCGTSKVNGVSVNMVNQNTHQAWCAYFVSWVYWKAGHQFKGGSAYNPIGLTDGIRSWFAARGKWYANTSYNRAHHPPSKGDFVDYNNGAHSGIVDKVYNGTLFSVDGNLSNNVGWDQTNSYATSGTVTGWGHL